MSFSPRQLRSALGMFPTGVTIVTARTPEGRRIGVTVNSFTSVSLEPPLISFCLAKSLGSLPELLQVDSFVVNVLTQAQSELSTCFARAATDKWARADSRDGHTENPILEPNLAFFECARYAVHEAGDHLIFLGQVLRFEINEREEPLVFFRGQYRRIHPLY